MPTAPPAPVRLMTTTGSLSDFCITLASGRPTMSATPPGGNGTIIVIGFDGESCATIAGESAASAMSSMVLMASSCGQRYTLLQLLHFVGSLVAGRRVK